MDPTLGEVLDDRRGVPFYRQIIDRVLLGLAAGRLGPGDRLPTVRQLAVDLQINPNTVSKAYRELELVGIVETRPGDGTFVVGKQPKQPEVERRRQLDRLCRDLITQAQGLGFSLDELLDTLKEFRDDNDHKNERKLGRRAS